MRAMRSLLVTAFVLSFVVACGKGGAKGKPPPDRPYTGAPVTVIVDKIKSKEALDVSIYNFSDKKLAGWWLMFRDYDKDGNVLKLKPGTPFEDDHDFMSLSGNDFLCEPTAWCSFEVDMLEIPEGTVRADSLARTVRSLQADGFHFDDQ